MRTVIPIVMAADINYLSCAAVAIKSLIDTKGSDTVYKIHILYVEKDALFQKKIMAMSQPDVKISFYNIMDRLTPYLGYLYPRAYYTMEMYFRWWIGDLFPKYDKVIYLDCDVIVNCDLLPLYSTDLGNDAVGGVIDFATPTVIRRIAKQLQLSANKYINSGVLLINSAIWREEHLREKCLSSLAQQREYVCPDQDVLNIICEDRITFLDPRWNAQWHHLWDDPDNRLEEPYLSMFSLAMTKPNILHFSSRIKPWNSPPNQYSEHFWRHAKALGFFSVP